MKREKIKKYIRMTVLAILTLGAAALITVMPSRSAAGVKNGLIICAQTVIPALFPFCVLSSFFVRTGLCTALGRKISPITRLLFRLPGEAGGAVLMGLCGGYPVGAAMTAELLENGALSKEQAGRLMLFCINAGPAFVIGAVGAGMLGSARAGAIIFLSLTLASLTVGVLTRFIPDEENVDCVGKVLRTLSCEPVREALPGAVTQGTTAMLSICAWVMLFSCAAEFLPLLNVSDSTQIILNCFLEVTRGSAGAVSFNNVPIIAATLGWGGVCVHCQVMRHVRLAGVPLSRFVCARVINAALSALICSQLLKIFPCTVSVYCSGIAPMPAAYSFSAPAAAAMLLMGAVFILELDTKNRKC